MKILKRNQLKIVIFTAVKNRCMLYGQVFVMLNIYFIANYIRSRERYIEENIEDYIDVIRDSVLFML